MLQQLRNYTRARRRQLFAGFLGQVRAASRNPLRIVDLGGTVRFWEVWGLEAGDDLDVTLVNNHRLDRQHANDAIRWPNIRRMNADVTELAATDLAAFDIIFSNSLIEHLPGYDLQQRLAQAIMGARRPYFVQTPNRTAPIDPHFPRPYVPFFAAYPRKLQARLLTWSALGSGSPAPSYAQALVRLANYHPLSVGDVRELFPGASVVIERPLGVPMSIVAMSPGAIAPATVPVQPYRDAAVRSTASVPVPAQAFEAASSERGQ